MYVCVYIYIYMYIYMYVRRFPKWRYPPIIHFVGFSIINHPFSGTPILGNAHIFHQIPRMDVIRIWDQSTSWQSFIWYPSLDINKTRGLCIHLQTCKPCLVAGLVAMNFIFPYGLGCCHHPNWRTHIFQRGFSQPPSSFGFDQGSNVPGLWSTPGLTPKMMIDFGTSGDEQNGI